MAVIQDMMPAFELFRPARLDDALELMARYGESAWALAGGLDTFDWLKDRIKRPEVVVDLGAISEMRGITADGGGLTIGAMTTLTEVATSPEVVGSFSLLSMAAAHVATPQIRNQGTLGGNVAQDTRCWYYRGGWPCYRAGGNICYAAAPKAMNREHCIIGASRCVAVNPSDTAPALIALDAQMVIRSANGERVVDAEDFFMSPAVDITRMTVLEPDELLTEIRIPETWSGARFYFEKVRDRQSWDFSLVTVASAMRVSGGTVQDARIVVNGVAPVPVRVTEAEAVLIGSPADEAVGLAAGEAGIRGSKPLRHNDFKRPLMRNLIRRAIRGREA
ncbi:MAG: xanthine dehydrogenase family protein subunit M [Gemmatimonadetes bacterium]|nr:xanthine dehydrogenase family protein subunit M [Gemmatimonadota bacterium]